MRPVTAWRTASGRVLELGAAERGTAEDIARDGHGLWSQQPRHSRPTLRGDLERRRRDLVLGRRVRVAIGALDGPSGLLLGQAVGFACGHGGAVRVAKERPGARREAERVEKLVHRRRLLRDPVA